VEDRLLTGVDAEKVGADAASELLRNIDAGGCVDDFLQDQVNDMYASTSSYLPFPDETILGQIGHSFIGNNLWIYQIHFQT